MERSDSSMTSRTYNLNPVVVTGSGHHQRLRSTATPVRVLSSQEIKEQGITTFDDALTRMMPQASMAPNSMGTFLRLNGLGNKYILILINGQKLSGDISNNVDLNRINMARVKRIEVLDGAALPAERFHFINTEQVFEHLVDPGLSGERLVAALRPGGILRISVPNGTNVPELLADADWSAPKGSPRSLNAVAPLEHLNCFSYESLTHFGSKRLELVPMQYPVRQFLEPWERIRFAVSAVVHALRPPKGTMLLFRKP
jgi:SAM-dependent methyltransferase